MPFCLPLPMTYSQHTRHLWAWMGPLQALTKLCFWGVLAETQAPAKDTSQGEDCFVSHLLKVNKPPLAAAGLATCFLTGWFASVPLLVSETMGGFMGFLTFLFFVSRKFSMHPHFLCTCLQCQDRLPFPVGFLSFTWVTLDSWPWTWSS